MKKAILLLFVGLTFFGCQKEKISVDNLPTAIHQKNNSASANDAIVVWYNPGVSDEEKEALRQEMDVDSYETCHCANPNLELWIFDTSSESDPDGYIEDRRATAKAKEHLENAETNISLIMDDATYIAQGFTQSFNQGLNLVAAQNEGVTVAILDTGIDYGFFAQDNPFLYNCGENSCSNDPNYPEVFGWNFVDDNNNPYDDYYGKHGTINTAIIHGSLIAEDVPHRILPVKVANAEGQVKYFDALCGFIYAAQKEDVKIINMSFGWYDHELEILNDLIDDASIEKLVVASAGNRHNNNDIKTHFPSSFTNENVFAIAAFDNTNMTEDVMMGNVHLADYSNFGTTSVDMACPGRFSFNYQGNSLYVSGTSYSAAYGSYLCAKEWTPWMSPAINKQTVVSHSLFSNALAPIHFSTYAP